MRGDGLFLEVELIYVWEREELHEPTAALTFKNLALAIFHQLSAARRVILVSTRGGVLLFLIDVGGQWRDVKTEPVTVTVVKNS